MIIKPTKPNEADVIESARKAYNQLTGGRGIRVEFSMNGDFVLLSKPRTGESIGLFNPATQRFLDPRIEKLPARGTPKFHIEDI